MSLIFNNVELLGYSHQNNFFGEKSFNYSTTKTISLQGFTLNLVNNNSVQTVFNAINSITNQSKDFVNVVINNINYGVGKITELSFDDDNWIQSSRFNASITILGEAPIQNIGSSEFTGLSLNDKKLNLIKNFSESFTLDFDTQNKILGGEHSIEIEYDADNKNINLIGLAQSFASALLKTLPSNLAEGNYIERTKYKTLHSENYDLVNGKCGFNKKFSYKAEDPGKKYSINRTNSIQLGEDGITVVSETGEIKGEEDPTYESALSGLNTEVGSAFGRISSLYNTYKSKFKISVLNQLNNDFVEKSVQINKFLGTITYTIVYDDDIKKKNPDYTFEYANILEKDTDGIWTSSEKGTIKGKGKIGSEERYKKARTAWASIRGSVPGRITSFYNQNATDKLTAVLRESSLSVSKENYNGVISYNYSYSADPSILTNNTNGVTKASVEKSDTGILDLTKEFIIPNENYPVVQNRNLKKQGTFKTKATLEIGCLDTTFNGKQYFSEAKQYAGGFEGVGNDNYLESITFTSDEIEKVVSYEAVYKYS